MTTTARKTTRPALRQPASARRQDLAEIHVLAKQLQFNDDEYRDVMATVCGGVRSAGELCVSGRARFLAHLRACAARQRPQQAPAAPRLVRGELTTVQKRMWALWMQLVDAKLAEQRTMAALCAWVGRQTQVHRIEWLTPAQERQVVEALKAWLARGG
jgi:hypothetical protein